MTLTLGGGTTAQESESLPGDKFVDEHSVGHGAICDVSASGSGGQLFVDVGSFVAGGGGADLDIQAGSKAEIEAGSQGFVEECRIDAKLAKDALARIS